MKAYISSFSFLFLGVFFQLNTDGLLSFPRFLGHRLKPIQNTFGNNMHLFSTTTQGASVSNTTYFKSPPQSRGFKLSNSLFELKSMSRNDMLIRRHLQSIIAEFIDNKSSVSRSKSNSFPMTTYLIGKSFTSIQHLSVDRFPELNQIIKFLLQKIPDKGFDCRTITSILTGLKSSSCGSPEVTDVLQFIVNYLQQNPSLLTTELDMKSLSMILRATKSFSFHNKEVFQIYQLIVDALDTIAQDRSSSQNVRHKLRFSTGEELASVMAGLSSRDGDEPIIQRLLIHISSFLRSSSSTPCSNHQVREKSSNEGRRENEGRQDTSTTTSSPSIDSVVSGTVFLSGVQERHIASMLYGLQGIKLKYSYSDGTRDESTYEKAVKSILGSFAHILNRFHGSLTAETIGTGLYGLQNIGAHCVESRLLIREIATKIDPFDGSMTGLTGQLVAMACQGLKTISEKVPRASLVHSDSSMNDGWNVKTSIAEHSDPTSTNTQSPTQGGKIDRSPQTILLPEVRTLVGVLADYISASSCTLAPSELARAMFGLQQLSADIPQIRRLLQVLTSKMTQKPTGASIESIYTNGITIGYQNLANDESGSGVLTTSDTYDPKLHLSAKEITMLLQGFRSMGSEWACVRSAILMAAELINASPARMRAREIATALCSLQTMGGGGRVAPASSADRPITAPLSELSVASNSTPSNGSFTTSTNFPLNSSDTDNWNISTNKLLGNNQNLPKGDVLTFHDLGMDSRRRFKTPRELTVLLDALVGKLESRCERLSASSVGLALYGMQGLSCESGAAKRIIVMLTEDLAYSNKIHRSLSETNTTSNSTSLKLSQKKSQSVKSNNNNITHPGLTNQTAVILDSLPVENDGYMDSRGMSNAVYGLQNTSVTIKTKHMHKLLVELAEAITLSPHSLTAQGVGNSLYGLQRMSSEVPSVRILLAAITKKIWRMPWSAQDTTFLSSVASHGVSIDIPRTDIQFDKYYKMSGQNIGNSLWGLRNMTSRYPEVRKALNVIALRIRRSDAELNGQNLGNALYSLHSMTNRDERGVEVKEVTEVLTAVAHKLVLSSSVFSSLDVAMSLYGLRSMDADSPIVRVILSALLIKMKNSPEQMHLRTLMIIIVGLLKTPTGIKDDFLRVLAGKMPGMVYMQ